MVNITKDHEKFLIKSANWIKSHRKSYCPISAVKHISKWKQIFKELTKWGLVQPYKSGNVIVITPDGWEWIAATYPEIIERHKKKK